MLATALPDLLARHPALSVHLGEGSSFFDLVLEGVDCVVRAGELPDSDMVVRRLGTIEETTVASPGYLAKHGTPNSPDDLQGHHMVGFVSSRTGQPLPLEFTRAGEVIEVTLPARMLVGGADTSAAAIGSSSARHRAIGDAQLTVHQLLIRLIPALQQHLDHNLAKYAFALRCISVR